MTVFTSTEYFADNIYKVRREIKILKLNNFIIFNKDGVMV